MIDKVYKTVREYGLIQKNDKIIIGLSGGADSVCLTHVLHSISADMGIELICAHMNHGIRGDEADCDAEFARSFSESLGIPFEFKKADIPSLAKEKGVSEELAGREARYAFFEELMQKYGFNKIATAHNKNDNAETILMNFMRGSGIKGLGGIPYIRGNIIRPILDCRRDEIEKYCEENGLKYVTDSTNNENIYTRNKIRLDLIPEIEKKFNSNFVGTVTENAHLIKEDSDFLERLSLEYYKKEVSDNKTDIEKLLKQPISIRNRVIFEMIRTVMGTASDVSSLFIKDITSLIQKGKSGAYITLPKGVRAAVEYGSLCIKKTVKEYDFEYEIPLDKDVYIPEMGKTVHVQFVSEKSGKGMYVEAKEADKIIIRNRREGDVFYPSGMNGRKKVKDFFIDSKIPREERSRVGILTINGEIADIIGKRSDRRYTFVQKGFKITIN